MTRHWLTTYNLTTRILAAMAGLALTACSDPTPQPPKPGPQQERFRACMASTLPQMMSVAACQHQTWGEQFGSDDPRWDCTTMSYDGYGTCDASVRRSQLHFTNDPSGGQP